MSLLFFLLFREFCHQNDMGGHWIQQFNYSYEFSNEHDTEVTVYVWGRQGVGQSCLDCSQGADAPPNTEAAQEVESDTRHKIVHLAPAQFSGTLVGLNWLLLVRVRYLFSHSPLQIKYFPLTCYERVKSVYCCNTLGLQEGFFPSKFLLIKTNSHAPNKPNEDDAPCAMNTAWLHIASQEVTNTYQPADVQTALVSVQCR